jgi:hypothetical protein
LGSVTPVKVMRATMRRPGQWLDPFEIGKSP